MKLTKDNIEQINYLNQNDLNGSIIKINNDECYIILTATYEGTVHYRNMNTDKDNFTIIKTVHVSGNQLFKYSHFVETPINIEDMTPSLVLSKDFKSIINNIGTDISKCEYLTSKETEIKYNFVTWLQETVIKSLYTELERNRNII